MDRSSSNVPAKRDAIRNTSSLQHPTKSTPHSLPKNNALRHSRKQGSTTNSRNDSPRRRNEKRLSGCWNSFWFSSNVRLEWMLAFRCLFCLLFLFDCWRQIPRAPKYTAGLHLSDSDPIINTFNVPHLSFLAALPLPSTFLMTCIWFIETFLCLRMALGLSVSFSERLLLPLLHGFTYFSSQSDNFQHHYLIFLILLVLSTFKPRRSSSPNNIFACWQYKLLLVEFSLLYFFTALAKLDARWMDGYLLPRFVSPIFKDQILQPILRYFVTPLSLPVTDNLLLSHQIQVFQWVSIGVVFIELFLAIAILLQAFYPAGNSNVWRPIVCFTGITLHLGLEFSGLQIGRFSYYMVLFFATLMPPACLTRVYNLVFVQSRAKAHTNQASASPTSWIVTGGMAVALMGASTLGFYGVVPLPVPMLRTILFTCVFITLMASWMPVVRTYQGKKKKNCVTKVRAGVWVYAFWIALVMILVKTTPEMRKYYKEAGQNAAMTGATYAEGARRAIPYYEKMVEIDPSHAEGFADLAVCYDMVGDKARSVELNRHVVEKVDETNVKAWIGLLQAKQREVPGKSGEEKRRVEREVCEMAETVLRRGEEVEREYCGYWETKECEWEKGFVRKFAVPLAARMKHHTPGCSR